MKVSCNVWKKAVEVVSEGVSNLPELLVSLKETERRVALTTHAAALFMPTQKLLKSILEDDPTVTVRDLVARVKSRSQFFKDFYKDNIYYTTIHTIYINRNNEIDIINKETFLLSTPNIITREEIVGILKKKSYYNDKRYKLISILKYNITLEPENVLKYINCNDHEMNKYNYLEDIKHIDEIHFEKCITMFQDLTDIYCIFFEKSTELIKKTVNSNNSTKKIYLKKTINKHKNTIRKQYKD
jgi:hypothetical protein